MLGSWDHDLIGGAWTDYRMVPRNGRNGKGVREAVANAAAVA